MKVKYIGCDDAQANFGSGYDPRNLLVQGQVYELATQEVHSWHTLFYLKGIDGAFNSVCFEEIPITDNLNVSGVLTAEIIEEAALRSAANMCPAQDIWMPGYGWIMRHGELTQVGADWFEEVYKPSLEKK